ncbi:MAG TPA: glycosyltransferase family 39 protein [Candidatus Dormibacteraeota bacterium]|nr:glycosyltransferase family 39 protein [Candidatus Dormibacteraeota bacterium]
MFFTFLVSLPLCNPWVRGDGIGYYAYARALLIDHNLRFEKDYLAGNTRFVSARVNANGRVKPEQYTATGHLDNHFAVGPAILWAPFLGVAHVSVLTARWLGSTVAADGYSLPYRAAMALGTAVYGFLGLWISFRLAKNYCAERWALLAALGIWWGSSLPVYMYFNPSWSHAHSAFSVALFLWYWHRTRDNRSTLQWALLGLLAGLMINVYYVNAMLLAAPGVEALADYTRALRGRAEGGLAVARLFAMQILFGLVTLAALAPTYITRTIIYGSPFESGYVPLRNWLWGMPAFGAVLFSSDHGLFSWTPILILSAVGLVLLFQREKTVGAAVLAAVLSFYLLISFYPSWDGMSSFGNRFFVSLTPLFVLGLSVTLQQAARRFASQETAWKGSLLVVGLFIVWNLAFIFQWGTHLVPARGPISWSEMAHNQVTLVPVRFAGNLRAYFFGRKAMMQHIEEEDIRQMKSQTPNND